tara:strand:- start:18163 stop:19065 length:903 start_codon:yes stop_codon:yes gene_type:complete
MLISVIIVNWNRLDDMNETLSSLQTQIYKNYEIVVVDNGSTDGSLEMIENKYPYVKLIKSDKNLGCEGGFNLGMENSIGDIFFYLDSDASLSNDVLERVSVEFNKNSKLGILDPRIVNPHNNSIINEPKNWPLKNHFTGCAAAIRSSVIEKIGMRPAEYFIYTSEADLSLRTIDANYTIEHFSDIVAFHRESPKKRLSSKFYYYYTRNGLWLIWKFYPFFPAIKETIIHLLYNFIKSLLALSPWHFFSGLYEGIRDFKKYSLDKRRPIDLYNDARLYPPIIVMISILFDKIRSLGLKNNV